MGATPMRSANFFLILTTMNKIKLTKSGAISKEDFIALWMQAEEQPLNPTPIADGHEGTTIDEDGIRICGSLDFIFAVCARLKDIAQIEATQRDLRVSVACSEISDRYTKEKINGKFRCSIQVHERGDALGMFWNVRKKRSEMQRKFTPKYVTI